MREAPVFLILAVLFVGAIGAGEPDPASGPAWEGKHSDELVAAWGPPTKIKRKGKDRRVLVYRLRFFGNETVGTTALRWSDAGVGPSPVYIEGRREGSPPVRPVSELASLRFGGSQEIVATQKVRFYVDRDGIIRDAEFSPLKWKNKP